METAEVGEISNLLRSISISGDITESRYHMNTTAFLSDQYKLFKVGYQVNPDASLIHVKVKKDCFNNIMFSEENENESCEQKCATFTEQHVGHKLEDVRRSRECRK